MAQYNRCSTNTECACLNKAGASDIGICSYKLLADCSDLDLCEPLTNFCQKGYECIHHPQCSNVPVCFPVPIDNEHLCPPINVTTTVAGGNGEGGAPYQLRNPNGLFVDDDQTVIFADTGNHRIIQWKKNDINGQVIFGGWGAGNQLHQLKRPTDVLIDKETNSLIIADRGNQRVIRWSRLMNTTRGEILIDNIKCYGLALDDQRYLYVSDWDKNEVRRYKLGDTNGTVVAGGNGKGMGLNQLKFPTYLFVDQQQNVYVSDSDNNRVMKWTKGAKEGIVLSGGKGSGPIHVNYPEGLFVDTLGTLYIADSGNGRVLRWPQGAPQGTVIVGGNGAGTGENQLIGPAGLSFDRQGNLYVADCENHRVQRFAIE